MAEDVDNGRPGSAYNHAHRAFLQSFLARSTLTFPEAKPILAAILSAHEERQILAEDITEADFANYVGSINAAISPFDLEIRATYTQTTPRTRIYALINTTSDPITQLATTHTPDEIAFVKRILDDMFDKYNKPTREIMAINSIQALQLTKAPTRNGRSSGVGTDVGSPAPQQEQPPAGAAKSISKSEGEKMLQSMVDEGWFLKHRRYYSLSPRALMELRGWLLETYNEPEDEDGEGGVVRIKLCQACRDIVTVGQRCRDRRCLARLHDHCAQGLFRGQREPKCPLCGQQWIGEDFVGERALREHDQRPSDLARRDDAEE